jgi:hypothetical protein
MKPNLYCVDGRKREFSPFLGEAKDLLFCGFLSLCKLPWRYKLPLGRSSPK